MVIQQSLGPASVVLDTEFIEKAKVEIQKIEHADIAVRTEVVNLVSRSTKPTIEEKRDEALTAVQKKNVSFALAVGLRLYSLLGQYTR